MEKEAGPLIRLLIGHALAVNYRHRAAAFLDVWLYRQGVAELEVKLYTAAQSFGLAEASVLAKFLGNAVPWLDFHQTRQLLTIN